MKRIKNLFGKNASNWKGGKSKCKDCGKELSTYPSRAKFHSGFCRPCSDKHLKGENNSHWKGGVAKTGKYICLYMPEHPNSNRKGYISEHRYICEAYLLRFLNSEEQVHHLNKDTFDNNPENLFVFSSFSEHHRRENENLISNLPL